jgi:predicted Zn-dependent protease
VRLIAIRLDSARVLRFKVLIPRAAPRNISVALRRMTYSLERIPKTRASRLRAERIVIYRTRPSDTVATLANRLPRDENKERRFRVLNGLTPTEQPGAGSLVKLISR